MVAACVVFPHPGGKGWAGNSEGLVNIPNTEAQKFLLFTFPVYCFVAWDVNMYFLCYDLLPQNLVFLPECGISADD